MADDDEDDDDDPHRTRRTVVVKSREGLLTRPRLGGGTRIRQQEHDDDDVSLDKRITDLRPRSLYGNAAKNVAVFQAYKTTARRHARLARKNPTATRSNQNKKNSDKMNRKKPRQDLLCDSKEKGSECRRVCAHVLQH